MSTFLRTILSVKWLQDKYVRIRADSTGDCGATKEIEHFLFYFPFHDRTDLVACSLAVVNC